MTSLLHTYPSVQPLAGGVADPLRATGFLNNLYVQPTIGGEHETASHSHCKSHLTLPGWHQNNELQEGHQTSKTTNETPAESAAGEISAPFYEIARGFPPLTSKPDRRLGDERRSLITHRPVSSSHRSIAGGVSSSRPASTYSRTRRAANALRAAVFGSNDFVCGRRRLVIGSIVTGCYKRTFPDSRRYSLWKAT